MSYTTTSTWCWTDDDQEPPKVELGVMKNGQVYLQVGAHTGGTSFRLLMRPGQFEAFDTAYSIALMQHRIESQEQAGKMESVQ